MQNVQNKTTKTRVFLSIELLKTFTTKEINAFKLFIDNKYLNADADLPVLLKLLTRYVLKIDKFTPDLQLKIYSKLFGEIHNNQATINKKQSGLLVNKLNKLLRLAEKFLMFETIKNTDEFNTTLLYPKLIERKQIMLYNRRLKSTEKKLTTEKKRGIDYYTQCYNIQQEKANLLFLNNALAKEDNYDVLQYYTDIKYLLENLQYHLAKITLKNVHPDKVYDFSSYKACEALFQLPQYQKNPLIKLWLLNIDLVQKNDDETYHLLLKTLQQYQQNIPSNILRPFYKNLNNYCAIQLSKGKLQFYQNLWLNYKVMHSNSLLVKENSIDIASLKNIVTVACRLDEFSWAIKILDENIGYVSKNMRDSVYNYNRGAIEFAKNNFDYALHHFNKVRKIDSSHFIALKIFMLQCFYEIDEYYETATQQMIDSFRIFISTKKINTKTSYKNFIIIFNKLYKFKHTNSKMDERLTVEKRLLSINDVITNRKKIWQKKWLLKKVEALQKLKLINGVSHF